MIQWLIYLPIFPMNINTCGGYIQPPVNKQAEKRSLNVSNTVFVLDLQIMIRKFPEKTRVGENIRISTGSVNQRQINGGVFSLYGLASHSTPWTSLNGHEI